MTMQNMQTMNTSGDCEVFWISRISVPTMQLIHSQPGQLMLKAGSKLSIMTVQKELVNVRLQEMR